VGAAASVGGGALAGGSVDCGSEAVSPLEPQASVGVASVMIASAANGVCLWIVLMMASVRPIPDGRSGDMDSRRLKSPGRPGDFAMARPEQDGRQ